MHLVQNKLAQKVAASSKRDQNLVESIYGVLYEPIMGSDAQQQKWPEARYVSY